MISYNSPTLNNDQLFNQLKGLKFFTSVIFHDVWKAYLSYAKDRNRVIGEPKLRIRDGEINVMGIRNNPEISFNLGSEYNNDILVIEYTKSQTHLFYVYKVTMDPKNKKHKIAHLLEQVAASYLVRPHVWQPGRTALCQDRNNVIVARTDEFGAIITDYKEHKGIFGINIHDAGSFTNSSLGCTVLEKDSEENNFHWKNSFKPLVSTIINKDEVDYSVINKAALFEFIKSVQLKVSPNKSFLDIVCFRAPNVY